MQTGPLTNGQRSVLRSLRVHGLGHQAVANLISVWEVPFGVGVAQVVDAWLQLVETHESLRTTYDEFVQTIHPLKGIRIPTVELVEDSATAAHQAAGEWAAIPIPIEQGPPWRAFVATTDGEPVYLVTVIHHVAADNEALRILEDQFGQLLSGGTVTTACQPLDMASAQQQEPDTRRLQHWVQAWSTMNGQDRNPEDTSERRRASLYSEVGLTAAKKVAERLRISVQSVLFGVSALAIARYEQRGNLTFALMAANRLDVRWAPLVSSLNQYAPVTVVVDESDHPDVFLRNTFILCMNAYVNGCYDVDLLSDHLAEADIQENDPTAFAKHFNFLGGVDAEPEQTSPMRTGVVWRPSTQRSGPNLHLALAVGQGVLIGVGASKNYIDDSGLAHLAASIEGGLLEIADTSEESLAQLAMRPVRTI
ncbi:condensation domain-containing protein [Rhodococcus erythropolis]|nr:condensation domain-containing protein [Rhodococcus erythropolis]